MEALVVVILRLVVAAIFAGGAIWLAIQGKDGWGWCIFASIILGTVTVQNS